MGILHRIGRALRLWVIGAGLAAAAQAQTFPTKPITIVVPFPAGSGTDQVARGMAQAISTGLNGAVVIVDNKPGASGMIAAQIAAHAPADGYTLFMTTNTTQSANPHLFRKLAYDPAKDFAPIAALAKGAMVLTVPTGSPIHTVAEFITLARKQPITFGAGNSSSRVAGELFKQSTDTHLTYVPYKGNPQAVTDLLGGQIDAMFADTATALPLVKSGKLRALGYTGLQRSSAFPQVPTLDEAGVKGYELSYWVAVYAPHGTPTELVQRLNDVFLKSVHSDAVANVFANAVLDVFTTTPQGLGAFQLAETEKWGRIIRAAGIEPE
jgi:tripartite-type tricarboxylate transporter receptor subunit TctC